MRQGPIEFHKTINSQIQMWRAQLSFPVWVEGFVQSLPWKTLRVALRHSLDFTLSYASGLRLKLTHLTRKRAEVRIPFMWRHLDKSGQIAQSVVLAGAKYGWEALWTRRHDSGAEKNISIQRGFKSFELAQLQAWDREIFVRFELSDLQFESWLVEAEQQGSAEVEIPFLLCSDSNAVLGQGIFREVIKSQIESEL